MNIPQARIISQKIVEALIAESSNRKFIFTYLKEKHQILIEEGQDWLAKIYLPWTVECSQDAEIAENPDTHFSLVLIRAGQAVTGYFHQGQLIDHKVFRAYMVRQKQGKSQIKHLKTKGKSRAGSRIRLAETERFFEEINERLTSYSSLYPIDFWGISCAKTMWPFYFSSGIAPPFSPKAENLIELPFHISQASFEELKSAGELLQKYHLILSEKGKAEFEEFETRIIPSAKSEDW
ncbi:MAG: hypothetical protein Q8S14_04255 [Algoriphagus sp.]|uniref:hypothetical protein n=1 Tax=Algoriphagus sp. TaxID=1872435 RepID=UPI00273099DD|nr:hypothetical protein [Algoriphagus sp.]MDP2041967.1 hypothetical protein [Algoriphagus sp.]MDP3471065.1 hypothetical protein [Algoriphagus sp.]